MRTKDMSLSGINKMKYMGSKSRIAKHIVPIIQDYIDQNNIKTYIEPFCGGCNIIDKIKCDTKIASDNHKYLIEMFKNMNKIQNLPDFITKEEYLNVKDCFNDKQNTYKDWYVGAIGFLASYNGKFFDGGYASIAHTKSGIIRNYYDEAKRNLLKQIPYLQDIDFLYGDYSRLYTDRVDCLMYCDPPYKDTTQYGTSKNFDHNKFWTWAKQMSEKNIVLVSEHVAPDGWKCIWKHEVIRTIDNAKRSKATEKLFIYER